MNCSINKMDNHQSIIEKISEQGLLPLFYHSDVQVCLDVTRALYAAGIRVIEFTNRGDQALQNFQAIVSAKNSDMKDLLLGAGTIRSSEQALAFMNTGADFLVSPVFDASVRDAAHIYKK